MASASLIVIADIKPISAFILYPEKVNTKNPATFNKLRASGSHYRDRT
jgi:hypothetical protein